MDELLALMEDPPPPPSREEQQEETRSSPNDAGLDELASLLDNDDVGDDEAQLEAPIARKPPSSSPNTRPQPPSYSRRSALVTPHDASRSTDNRQKQRSSSSTSNTNSTNKPVDIGLDDKLGIRIINRKISSVDIIDVISTNPYFTPATLSAMCLQRLSKTLVDPPQIVDRATVVGRATLVTIGILFSNTGTRFSKKGSAFCKLTMGNFTSGPCVSVLVFGDAYSQHCKNLKPGHVVAVVAPRLLPPSDHGGDTSLSLSVTDVRNLLWVGTAQDYGVCKATGVSKKQPNGQWTSTGTCQNFVDLRVCVYCDKHRKQKYKPTSNMKVGGDPVRKGGGSRMQQLRDDHSQVGAPGNRFGRSQVGQQSPRPSGSSMVIPNFDDVGDKKRGSSSSLLGNHPSISMHMKREKQSNNKGSNLTSSNRLLNGHGRPPARVPSANNTNKTNKRPAASNPVQQQPVATKKKKMGVVGLASLLKMGTKPPSTGLSRLARQQANLKMKTKKINSVGQGLDGSVMVPKPNKLFRNSNPAATQMVRTNKGTTTIEEPPTEQILQKQATVAQLLQERQSSAKALKPTKNSSSSSTKPTTTTTTTTTINNNNNNNNNKKSSNNTSFLDAMDIDADRVLNAKSRFETEANAEDYAKRRSTLVELEKMEASKNYQKGTQQNNNNFGRESNKTKTARITKEWHCRTCQKMFPQKPSRCIQLKHDLFEKRDLTKETTKTEQRFKLHSKDAADGGLQLGAGLDWDVNPYSRFN
jgi:hypothetical protein